ncbi:hypothetical protein GGR07_001330 [Bacteroides pyogenes]|nr:hypothetical protein [Bacteroides pyogenes]SUV33388.1 Uncharacterised protein [Bacteroides pyogenes]
MHNLHTIFVKFFDICKKFSEELANEHMAIYHASVLFLGP